MSDSAGITLQRVSEADTHELFALWSDFETVKFTNWTQLRTLDECAVRVERMLARYAPESGRLGPYVIRSREGDFVGLIGVDVVEGEHELWYLLRRDRWRRGFGTQAVSKLMQSVLSTDQIKRVVATAVADNIASWRLLERNGFKSAKGDLCRSQCRIC